MVQRRRFRKTAELVSAVFVVGAAIAGYSYPLAAFIVPGLVVAAVAMNARRRRSFCAGICPNGNVLGAGLRTLSRNRKLPAFLADPQLRRVLCGAMLFCAVGLTVRLYPDAKAIGRVFWSIYLIALSAGGILGLLYKPRAWCAVCPVGTLQDTIGGAAKKSGAPGRTSADS